MLAYVAHHAAADRVLADGTTQRVWWEASAKAGNREARAALVPPRFPQAISYLHRWFCELSAARGAGMSGPLPITHVGIDAWSRLMEIRPFPHEVAALFAMDSAWLHALRDAPKDEANAEAPAPLRAWPSQKAEPSNA